MLFRDYMLNTYFQNREITNELANQLIKHRNSYSYPNVRLIFSEIQTDFKISDGVWAEPVETIANQPTDLNLDKYHHELLCSLDPVKNLLGTASVIFWGFYTFKPNYALNKLRWHLYGNNTKPASTTHMVNQKISLAKYETNPGKALLHLSDLSQLGSIPFASKIIAFLKPDITGIYDNQIHKGLMKVDWYEQSGLDTRIGSVKNGLVQKGYEGWCDLLVKLAEDMNKGIAAGKQWEWKEPSGSLCQWRALDIERSLFSYFKYTN